MQPIYLEYCLILLAGAMGQFALLLDYSNWKWNELLKILGAAAVAVIFFPTIPTRAIIFFIFGLAVMLKERIIPRINERVMLLVGLSTWYLIFSHRAPPWLTIIYSGIMSLIIMNAILNLKPNRFIQVCFFCLYFISIITASLLNFDLNVLKIYLDGNMKFTNSTEIMVYGMTLSFVIIHTAFLLNFLPGKHERHYLERMKKYTKLLDERYDENAQMRVAETLIIVFGLGLVLVVNLFYTFIPDSYVLILILLAGSLERIFKTKKMIQISSSDTPPAI